MTTGTHPPNTNIRLRRRTVECRLRGRGAGPCVDIAFHCMLSTMHSQQVSIITVSKILTLSTYQHSGSKGRSGVCHSCLHRQVACCQWLQRSGSLLERGQGLQYWDNPTGGKSPPRPPENTRHSGTCKCMGQYCKTHKPCYCSHGYFGMFSLGSLDSLARPPNMTAFWPTRLKECPRRGQGGSERGVSRRHSHRLASNSYSCKYE